MQTNLISRLIHATVPVTGGGEWVVLGEEEKHYQKCLECDFRLIWRLKKSSALGSPKVGGGSPDWDTIPICSVFFSDSSPYDKSTEMLELAVIY